MKILLISMHSIHVTRWIENLKESGHELFWFDVTGKGKINTLETITQFTKWKKRKLALIRGEYYLSKKFPDFYQFIRPFLEATENEVLEQIIGRIQPDLIQSFEMQSCCYPILETMLKYPKIKWLYNCWGNDIFYYQNLPNHKAKLNQVLSRIDYMTSDCNRDAILANQNGFKGGFLGVIPTGGGYDFSFFEKYKKPFSERKIILIKGYQNIFGRGLNIIKALQKLKTRFSGYEIIIFGAHTAVVKYVVENDLRYKIYERHDLTHLEMIKLMGKSLLYIGNNISDGMANTLLEAIIMGAFPIQSNPGNVSAEIIEYGSNGFLIEDPENIDIITELITQAIDNREMLQKAAILNNNIATERLDYAFNQKKIIDLYKEIESCIKCE